MSGFYRYRLIVYEEGVLVVGSRLSLEDLAAVARAAVAIDPSWTRSDCSDLARRADGRLAIGSRESLAAWRARIGVAPVEDVSS